MFDGEDCVDHTTTTTNGDDADNFPPPTRYYVKSNLRDELRADLCHFPDDILFGRSSPLSDEGKDSPTNRVNSASEGVDSRLDERLQDRLVKVREPALSVCCAGIYIHTYIHTYIHAFIPCIPCIPCYIHTCLHLPTCLPTYLRTYVHTYIAVGSKCLYYTRSARRVHM